MSAISKPVTSDAAKSEEDLIKIAKRFSVDTYKRPIENESELRGIISTSAAGRKIILDAGCGVGESTFHIANGNREKFVLGVDKSESRVSRKNAFKKDLPGNALLLKADMQSVWPLLHKMLLAGEIELEKQFILYPNPWPKAKGLKKRWYANPMLAYILSLGTDVEIRSNWKTYLEDFEKVFLGLGCGSALLEKFVPQECMTPFERKYHASGQALYKLRLMRSEPPIK